MDRRELIDDYEEAIRAALDGRQVAIWTALPGIVEDVSGLAGNGTITVQPAIKVMTQAPSGIVTPTALPLLLDVPVQLPQGGDVVLTLPLAAGDEVLIILASRCIDAWFTSGGVQLPSEYRLHNLSDGFAIPGIRSLLRKLTGYSTTTAQLRSVDGSTIIELDPVAQRVNITAPQGVYMNGVRVDNTHQHTGVQSGPDDTGPPVGGP